MIDVSRSTRTFTASHPSKEQLVAYSRGLCDDQHEQEISSHVLQCEVCCQVLLGIPDDPLLERLGDRAQTQDTDAVGTGGKSETDLSRMGALDTVESERIDQLISDHPKYQLIRRLGEGGMGVVFLARHRIMDRNIALKVISPRMIRHPDARTRFQREVQIVAKLNHPNIVAAFDADQVGENLCLVSEYFESESLDQIIAKGPVEIAKACEMVRQAANGLAHAHSNGLIHRDVKPQNILVASNGQVKVVDFGLASYAESEHPDQQGLTSAGVIVGTPDFMSPEQVRESTVDHRADIYGLGCTLYHLLAGNPPFAGYSRVEKLAHHLQTTPKSLRSIRPEVSPALDACVTKMMAKDPDQRFQSADEVAIALSRCGSNASMLAVPLITQVREPVSMRGKAKRAVVPKKLIMGVITALLIGLVGLGVFVGNQSGFFATDVSIETLRQRPWKILAVIPPDPLPRDRALLYQAIEKMGLACEITSTSTVDSVEHVHNVIALQDANPADYDTVIFLGPSQNTDSVLYRPSARSEINRIVGSLEQNRCPYGAMGTGVWTLGHLGVLDGKRVANCEHSSVAFKRQSGAKWIDGSQVVSDGNLVTGTNTSDAVPFLKTLLGQVIKQSS